MLLHQYGQNLRNFSRSLVLLSSCILIWITIRCITKYFALASNTQRTHLNTKIPVSKYFFGFGLNGWDETREVWFAKKFDTVKEECGLNEMLQPVPYSLSGTLMVVKPHLWAWSQMLWDLWMSIRKTVPTLALLSTETFSKCAEKLSERSFAAVSQVINIQK